MASTSILSFHEVGQGLPVLVVHGWPSQGRAEEHDFEPIFSTTTGLRRIYIDLPGMGTTPARGIRNLDDIYDRLVQFVDAHIRPGSDGAGRGRFLLIGTSCGGYLAHALAQQYHEHIDGLLLRVPLVQPDNSKRDIDAFTPLIQSSSLALPPSLGNILIQTPEYVTAFQAKHDRVNVPATEAADHQVLDPIRADPQRYRLSAVSNSAARLAAPALILVGRHDDVVGYRDSRGLLDLYPRSTYAVLDRAPHGLPIDDADTLLFQALVRNWLSRVEEWRRAQTQGR